MEETAPDEIDVDAPLADPSAAGLPAPDPSMPRLDQAMHTVYANFPWAIGFTVTDRSAGALVYFLIETDDAEDDAYTLWGSVRRLVGSTPMTLVCLPRDQADALELSADARAYGFR